MNGVKTKLDDANRELVKDSSGYHISMGKWWEELAGQSIENF